SAKAALEALTARGVRVKVLTGDNELVTQHVCTWLGLDAGGMVTGAALAHLDDQALGALVERTTLFCRVTPAQKNRVILALRRRGHVVGFLGDGINDAPSLHSADVGLSVDGAVDVAKEAAALILLEHDLGVLHDGVLEGRRTFGNVMKYVMMATSSNFGNMVSMAGAAALLPFLPMLPLQILLNNLLYDVSELPIPMDEVDAAYLDRPRRWDMTFVRNFMMAVGPVSSVFDFLTFFVLVRFLGADDALFHTGWFVESLAGRVRWFSVTGPGAIPPHSGPSRWLVAPSLSVVGTAMLLPFSPAGPALGFVPLPSPFFAVLAVLVGAYLVAVEVVKRWFYRRVSAPFVPDQR